MKSSHPLARGQENRSPVLMGLVIVSLTVFAVIWGRAPASYSPAVVGSQSPGSNSDRASARMPAVAPTSQAAPQRDFMVERSPVVTPVDYAAAGAAVPTRIPAQWLRVVPTPRVNAVLPVPDGSVWVATEGGLVRLHGDRVTTFESGTRHFPWSNATALAHDGTSLWIGTFDGLLKTGDGSSFETFTREQGLIHEMVWSLHWDGAVLWIGTQGGFSFLDPDGVFHSVDPEISGGGLADLWIGAIGRAGQYLLVGNDDGVSIWNMEGFASDPDSWVTNDMFETNLLHNWILALTVFQGELWLGTPWGVARLETPFESLFNGVDGKWNNLTPEEGLPGPKVRAFAAKGDRLWIGTSNGLAVFRGNNIRGVTPDGLLSPEITSLAFDGGTLWVGTQNGVQALNAAAVTDF